MLLLLFLAISFYVSSFVDNTVDKDACRLQPKPAWSPLSCLLQPQRATADLVLAATIWHIGIGSWVWMALLLLLLLPLIPVCTVNGTSAATPTATYFPVGCGFSGFWICRR